MKLILEPILIDAKQGKKSYNFGSGTFIFESSKGKEIIFCGQIFYEKGLKTAPVLISVEDEFGTHQTQEALKVLPPFNPQLDFDKHVAFLKCIG